jgi:hypothetical protein
MLLIDQRSINIDRGPKLAGSLEALSLWHGQVPA